MKEKLKQLGFDSYSAYLASDHWKAFKLRWRAAPGPKGCAVCGSYRVQLHHNNYSRLGEELIQDVNALCGFDHEQVHLLLKERKWPVWRTAAVIDILRQRLESAQAKRLAPVKEAIGRIVNQPRPPKLPRQKRRRRKRGLWREIRDAVQVDHAADELVKVRHVSAHKMDKSKAKAALEQHREENAGSLERMLTTGQLPPPGHPLYRKIVGGVVSRR